MHTQTSDAKDAIFGSNGKVVAVIIDNMLHKRVFASKHFLRKPPAIAFDKSVIDEARSKKATDIMVHDRESKKRYKISMDSFVDNAFQIDRGHGVQLALAIGKWTILDPRQFNLFKN